MKNSMDRRGFLRLGLLERPRWPPAQVAAKRPCRPRPTAPAFRTLSRTGMKITIVSMGAMRTSEPAIFQAAFDGVNYIDTARGYMDGRNEGDGGRSAQGYRDRVYVATKVKPGSKEAMIRSIDESLSSLKVDYVDLLQLHALSSAEQVMNTELRGAGQEVGKDAVHPRSLMC